MRQESGNIDGSPVLASNASGSPVLAPSAAGAASADATVALGGIGRLTRPRALRVPKVLYEARAGKIALGTIVGGIFLMVLYSTHGPTILVPRSSVIFAPWEA